MKLKSALLIAALSLSFSSCFAQSVTGTKSVQLTVYNGGFALVRDTRGITLKQGMNSIEVEDVAARIDPTSILFKTLTAPNSVGILEQNYQYDLISPDNILNKSVGERITFTSFDTNGKPFTQTGVLMAPPSNGGVVIKMDDGSMVLRPQGQVSLQKMPEGLHPKPTLNWLLQSDRAGDQDAQISYITDGIGWKADYVALVNKDDTALDLTGWVTLDNKCGATYSDAKLTLMAGDVRRVQPQVPESLAYGGVYMDKSSAESASVPGAELLRVSHVHNGAPHHDSRQRDQAAIAALCLGRRSHQGNDLRWPQAVVVELVVRRPHGYEPRRRL